MKLFSVLLGILCVCWVDRSSVPLDASPERNHGRIGSTGTDAKTPPTGVRLPEAEPGAVPTTQLDDRESYKGRAPSDGLVDIRDFGAEAGTDATQAIREALASMGPSGGALFIPPGVWYTDPIDLKKNVTVEGTGMGSILRANTVTVRADALLDVREANNVRIDNLTIDGNRTAQDGASISGIYIKDSNDVAVTRCKVLDVTQHGIGFEGGAGAYIAGNRIQDYGTETVGFGVIAFREASDVRIADNKIDSDHKGAGIGIDSGTMRDRLATKVTHVTVTGNVVRGTWEGIFIEGSRVVTVKANTIEGAKTGIFIGDDQSGLVPSEVVVSGNVIERAARKSIDLRAGSMITVDGNTMVATDLPEAGINVHADQDLSNVFVQNNSIRGHQTGIASRAAEADVQGLSIQQNNVISPCEAGIAVRTASGDGGRTRGVTVTGNTVRDPQGRNPEVGIGVSERVSAVGHAANHIQIGTVQMGSSTGL
jgi:nitrous oxidase accessory protein NosD